MVGTTIKHLIFLITSFLVWVVYIPISSADDNDSVTANNSNVFDLSIEELFNTEVTGVSGFSEKVSEAPAPVTVIDQKMIEQSGVYTLRDLLSLYVPSFTQVQDQNEYNVSFRGIYTSSQQKFLITLNGHRLNSRAYSMANPDHSIALEKIARIEINRGPGASIYGNIALTSVINIVTKTVEQTTGLTTAVEVGNHGYKELYAQYANINDNFSHFSWFKWLATAGERVTITPQNDYSATPYNQDVDIYLDSFNSQPSMDMGATINFTDDLDILVNYRQGHYREPFTTGGISGEAYPREYAIKVNGVTAGAQSKSLHLSMNKKWQYTNEQQISFKTYFDTNHILGAVGTSGANGAFVDVAWRDQDYGLKSRWIHTKDDNVLMVGLDYEQFTLKNSKAQTGALGQLTGELTFTDGQSNNEPVLRLGSETITSAYAQYKYSLSNDWLANIGFRYDIKERLTGPNIKELSPRAAIVYNGDNRTVKLSYSRAFVDPPYWNRYSRLGSFRGSELLKPEILQSLQLTPSFILNDNKMKLKLNFYYNHYSDVVYRRTTALPDEPLFINAGELTTIGIEQEWLYQFDSANLRFVGNHYMVQSVEGYGADDNEIFNIPRHQYNLIFNQDISENLSYQTSMKFLSARRSPINIANNNQPVLDPFPNEGVDFQVPDHRLGSVLLFNANLRWHYKTQNTLSFAIHNLFDKQWQQGGSVVHPYQQTGRWFSLKLEHKW